MQLPPHVLGKRAKSKLMKKLLFSIARSILSS
jgi:hypothetical protein